MNWSLGTRMGEGSVRTLGLRSQAVVMRVTVIVWLSLCVSVWLCNRCCMPV